MTPSQVHSGAIFRLSNTAGLCRHLDYTEYGIDILMSEKLDAVHLAWNVFPNGINYSEMEGMADRQMQRLDVCQILDMGWVDFCIRL